VEKGLGVWAKQPSSTSPPSRYRTEEGVDREAGRWRGRGAGDPVHGDDREVGQNEEELEGNRFRSLPWAGVLWRGGSTACGGAACGGDRGGTGGGDGGLGGEGEMVVEVRGATESRAGPFIGTGRSVRGDILSFAELQWPAMEVREKSRRGLRPEGFSVDLVLCELTCRAGAAVASEGRPSGSNGGQFWR
jgi:hypothetical protein